MRVVAAVTIVAALSGCGDWRMSRSGPTPAKPIWQADSAPAADAPSTRPARGDVMAYVNGEAIYMDTLNDLLLRSQGSSMAMLLATAKLAEQEALRSGISVTDADIKAEENRSMEQAFSFVADAQQRYRLLEQELARRTISPQQWQIVLRRNALLRKLASRDVKVTDAELREEFSAMYGRKVVVRHIQTDTLVEAQEIMRKLAQGEDFGELSRRYSSNRTSLDGGLLPAITAESVAVPPPIRDAALAMTKVGDVSKPIQTGTAFHILRLEELTPARNVKFEDVQAEVQAAAADKKVRAVQTELFKKLLHEAKIEYVNPVLKAETPREAAP